MTEMVTVAVCTHNPDLALLDRVLTALAAEVAGSVPAELLVIDNNSRSPVPELHGARVVREPVPGLTAAREAAIREARHEIVLFVDDDNVLHPGYVRVVSEAFAADARLGMFGGSVTPELDETKAAWLGNLLPTLAIRAYQPDEQHRVTAPPYCENFPIGAGMAIRTVLARAYVTDSAQRGRIEGRRGDALSSGEDLDLALFVLSQGSTLLVNGSASLTHVIADERLTPAYITALARANAKSVLELEAKWAPRFGVPIFPGLDQPRAVLGAKAAAGLVLGLVSPRMRVRGLVCLDMARTTRRREHR